MATLVMYRPTHIGLDFMNLLTIENEDSEDFCKFNLTSAAFLAMAVEL